MTFQPAVFTIRHRKGLSPIIQSSRAKIEGRVMVDVKSKAESSLYKGLAQYHIKSAADPFPNWVTAYSDELEFDK